jgi:hypothetical protein
MLDRNIFYRTYTPLKITSMQPVNSENINNDPLNFIPAISSDQNYRVLAVYSLTKEDLIKILAEISHLVSLSGKYGQFTFDLKPFISPEVIEGLEIWV